MTLALGIGANAAIFSVVRGVLLKPLVNREESRLIYIRQSAPGLRTQNANFSVPEIQDLRARARSVTGFGEFSTVGFTVEHCVAYFGETSHAPGKLLGRLNRAWTDSMLRRPNYHFTTYAAYTLRSH